MTDDFFEQARRQDITLASGELFHLPVLYTDATEIMAVFPASTDDVRELLPSGDLQPVEIMPGKAIVGFAAWEYPQLTQADGAPGSSYNELVIAFPVLYEPSINVPILPLLMSSRFNSYGEYIYKMFVTTEQARDLGIELWGTPKSLAEITFDETDHTRCCRVRADGQDVLTLEVEKTPVRPRRVYSRLYTIKDDRLLRWAFETEGDYGTATLHGRASLRLGSHLIAETLRQLDIGTTVLEREYGRHVRGMLHLPIDQIPMSLARSYIAAPALPTAP
jgi:hypothetical protein